MLRFLHCLSCCFEHKFFDARISKHIYYQLNGTRSLKFLFTSYLASQTWYDDSDLISRSVAFFNQSPENNIFWLFDCLFVWLENLAVQPNSLKLAVQPKHEKPGGPNFPTNKKIFLGSFEYSFLNKHVKHLDKQMGARHYIYMKHSKERVAASNKTG